MFKRADAAFFSLPGLMPLLILLLAFALVAYKAVKSRHLTVSGAAAAVIVGTVSTYFTGFGGLFLLFAFYLSSNLIGKLRMNIQKQKGTFIEKKGSCRDWVQVLANSAAAVAAAVLWRIKPDGAALVMLGAAMAEAASDTWAGEIGRLSRKAPVSLKTGKPVEPGVSGGVTALGFLAGFGASLFMAILWILCFPCERPGLNVLLVCAAGFAGCVADSVLGACWQALYKDEEKGVLSEHPVSPDGRKLKLIQGAAWLDNDAVNVISNVLSAILAFGIYRLLF